MRSGGVSTLCGDYALLVENLKAVINASRARVMAEPPDALFLDNLNFFTKAYLVSLCTCLEAFLQDAAYAHVSLLERRLAIAKIPKNAVRWAVSRDVRDKEFGFVNFALSMDRKELSDELSGNPGKTVTLFRCIGIDLQASASFRSFKDVIGAVVSKRNNIIHHNDSAGDISLSDLLNYADQILAYMKTIAECVEQASKDT
jgi:hypothetical protein